MRVSIQGFAIGAVITLLYLAWPAPICADGIEGIRLADPVRAETGPGEFVELSPAHTGIDFTNSWQAPEMFRSALTLAFVAGGVAIGDYDGDGLPDLYLSRPFGGGRLYKNLGAFRFQDVTRDVGLRAQAPIWEAGCSFVDIDGDGDLDLYVCAFRGSNRLYLNERTAEDEIIFREVAKECGLDFAGFSVMMAFADMDLDGDLDGYLVTNRPFSTEQSYRVSDRRVAEAVHRQLEKKDGMLVMPERLREIFDLLWNPEDEMQMFVRAGQYDHLYRNDGVSQDTGLPEFTDITREAGLLDNGMGLSATWWDFNDDGLPDLYVANDYYGPDRLYRNLGNGRFQEVTREAVPHTPWYSMGTNVSDLNNDGLFDFMASDMMGTNHFRRKIGMGDMERNAWFLDTAEPRQYMRNAVYVNTGTGRFLECAHLTGLANSDWTWSLKFGDLDNDGREDLFIANGMSGDFFNSDIIDAQQEARREGAEGKEPRPQPKRDANLAFRNLGDLAFADVSDLWSLGKKAASFGAALGDLDGDGDLDLVVNNFEDPVSVYRNDLGGDNHRVKIRLLGKRSNRFGIDAKVRLWTPDGRLQARILTLARSFYSSDEPVLHFGLGSSASIERLIVEWPGGVVQTFEDIASDHMYTITESDESSGKPFREIRKQALGDAMFRRSEVFPVIVHEESEFDDYARQPLLPQKLSQLGPGMAWGDVDGDGDEDCYLSGAAGMKSRILLNDNGRFQTAITPEFDEDMPAEDMAPVFFDADGDGDLDLFVVSGGVECEPDDAVLRDRLYINDGTGGFSRARQAFLEDRVSGGAACVADFDRDGDLDLFVGGRVVPGLYPETPVSRLWENDGKGTFSDATPEALRMTGLVTSSLWSDVNGDGWVDLIVTHEWGPVKVFINRAGVLDEVSETGIEHLTGWWNSIAGTDIDGDGDMDYAVGNAGLNTKYKASVNQPTLLYYGDLDGTGRPNIVEANFEGEICYPIRGKSCSSAAMPGLEARFPTFRAFAAASLQELYTPDRLQGARRFAANTLDSGLLMNVTPPGGDVRLEFRPLPRIAQVSPIYGLTFADVDQDTRPDLYVVQNFFGPQRETGRMNGGVSLLLRGLGDGAFERVWPDESGLLVTGDATALTMTDLNDDGRPDFVVGVNDGEQLAFEHRRFGSNAGLIIRLQGRPGNPTAVGARVSLLMKDGMKQTGEVYAGGGYLSQSSPRLSFGLGDAGAAAVAGIAVRWPDGVETRYDVPDLEIENGICRIRQPL